MKPPENMTKIVDRKRYSTKTAMLLAGNDYWDGHNYERSGTNMFLYRTPKGAYFTVTLTQWEGRQDSLEPINQDKAIELYEGQLSKHRKEYEDAFPGVEVSEA